MKKKGFLAIVLAGMLAFGAFGAFGCGGNAGSGFDEEIDAERTQIFISHYNGGVGNAWYKPLKQRFEAAYANYELNGKKGVQLLMSNHKTEGKQEISSVSSSKMDVYFSENFDYYEGCNKGIFLDISDAVTSVDTADGKSVESKLNAEQRNYFNNNGKYYALPHYAYYGGLNYNVDLFEDELLYLSANPSVNGGFIISLEDTRSNGPDGKSGTYDDGLPATYEEFFKLCERMVVQDIIPFTWSGEYGKAYYNSLLARLTATYEGKSQMMINFSFNGTAEHLVTSVKDDGRVVLDTPSEIDSTNGYRIYSTAGRYFALKFGEQMFSKRDYYDFDHVNNGTDSHTDAQTRYILSSYDLQQKAIAFFIDGTYWENEAYDVGAFSTLKNLYRVSREETRFAYMPMPKVDETHIGEKDVLIENGGSLVYINGNVQTRCPEKIEILKEFIKFINSDESLAEFVIKTNTFKAFDYELTAEQENSLSYYTRTVLEARRNGEVVFPFDNNAKFINNRSSLGMNATFSTNNYQFAMNALKDGVGAKDYFEQLESYLISQWNKG